MSLIAIYDEQDTDIRTALRQLRYHGIDEVLRFGNRIDLFEAIAATPETIVALIDLQSDDKLDNNFSGHRVIETIRRHPVLAARCRPVAYTIHARPDVIDLAHRHGAVAVISKHDLDIPREQVAGVDLVGFLRALGDTPDDPFGERELPGEVPVFPGVERARARMADEEARLQQALSTVLVHSAKMVQRPYFWHAVRYLADRADTTSVARWIAADFNVRTGLVDRDFEQLRGCLKPKYLVHGVDWAAFAGDLLLAAPARRLAPREDEMLRVLVRVTALEDVLRDPVIRRASHLDDAALAAVDRVVHPHFGVPKAQGNVGQWKHTDDVTARLRAIEPDDDARVQLEVDFVRAVNNLYDTSLHAEQQQQL